MWKSALAPLSTHIAPGASATHVSTVGRQSVHQRNEIGRVAKISLRPKSAAYRSFNSGRIRKIPEVEQRYMVGLKPVKATLRELKSKLKSVPPGPSSTPDTLASSTESISTEDLIAQLEKEVASLPLDSTEAILNSPQEYSPPTQHIPTNLGTPTEALRYLYRHALHALRSLPYRLQKGIISEPYLNDLVSILFANSMLSEARKLVELMKSSTHYQPSAQVMAQMESSVSPHTVAEIAEHMKRIEREHGKISDTAIIEAMEPFLRLQDFEAVKTLYSTLACPSSVASNLYLQSLLESRNIGDAKHLFQSMMEENHKTMGLRGADGNSFAILMHHHAAAGELNRVDHLLQTILTNQYVHVKPIHLEIALESFLSHGQSHKATSILRKMLRLKKISLSTTTAENLMWACAQTSQFRLGVHLHRALPLNGPSTSTLRYLQALKICLISNPSANAVRDKHDLELVNEKLRILEPAPKASELDDTSAKSPPTHQKEKTVGVSTTEGSKEVVAQELRSLLSEDAVDVDLLLDALKSMEANSTRLLEGFKMTVDTLKEKIPAEVAVQVLRALESPEHLSLAFSWLPSPPEISSNHDIFVQQLRHYALQATKKDSDTTGRIANYQMMKRRVERYIQESQSQPSWEARTWILKCMYASNRGEEALEMLEANLPTVQELNNTPSTYFLAPETIIIVPTRKVANGRMMVTKSDKKRGKSIEQLDALAHKAANSKGRKAKKKPQKDLDQTVSKEQVEELKVKARFQVPAQIADDLYAYCAILQPPIIDSHILSTRKRNLESRLKSGLLSPYELREVLSAAQLALRQRKASAAPTKDGYRVKARPPSL